MSVASSLYIDFLSSDQSIFFFAFRRHNPPVYRHHKPRSRSELLQKVLSASRVQRVIHQLSSDGETRRHLNVKSYHILNDMAHTLYGVDGIRWFAALVRGVLVNGLFEQVLLNKGGIEQLSLALLEHPVVILPTHRSYVDFLVLSLMMFPYNLPLPAICAGEDFKSMAFFGKVLRRCGGFFIRRTFGSGSDPLYWSLFVEYVQSILSNGDSPVEFFIEGTRSRSARSLHPKLGLLFAVCEAYVKRRVSDIYILPVNISYETRLEDSLMVWELLGVPKPKESTSGLWKARKVLQQNFGNIHMTFGRMISLHAEIGHSINKKQHNTLPRFISEKVQEEDMAIQCLAYRIVYEQQKGCVLCPSSLVSTVLLQQHSIHKDDLTKQVAFLKQLLERRGARVMWKDNDYLSIDRGLKFLGGFLAVDSENVSVNLSLQVQKGIYDTPWPSYCLNQLTDEQRWCVLEDAVKVMMLMCQQNQLVHFVTMDSLVAVVLRAYGTGQSRNELLMSCRMLLEILSQEFVVMMEDWEQQFEESLVHLETDAVIVMSDDRSVVHVPAKSLGAVDFLSRIVTPSLITAFLVCTWLLDCLTTEMTISRITAAVQSYNILLIKEGLLSFYETLSLEAIKNILVALINMDVLARNEAQVKFVRMSNKAKLEDVHMNLGKMTSCRCVSRQRFGRVPSKL